MREKLHQLGSGLAMSLLLAVAIGANWWLWDPTIIKQHCPAVFSDYNEAILDTLRSFGLDAHPKDYVLQEVEIGRLRKWALSLPKGCAREGYLSWLDYFHDQSTEWVLNRLTIADVPKPPARPTP